MKILAYFQDMMVNSTAPDIWPDNPAYFISGTRPDVIKSQPDIRPKKELGFS